MDRIQTRPTFKKPDLESTKTSGSGFATPIGKMSGQYNIVFFKQKHPNLFIVSTQMLKFVNVHKYHSKYESKIQSILCRTK